MIPWPEYEMRRLLGAELNPRALEIKEMTNIELAVEQIYKAAYNEAIDDAYKWAQDVSEYADEILKLKKE